MTKPLAVAGVNRCHYRRCRRFARGYYCADPRVCWWIETDLRDLDTLGERLASVFEKHAPALVGKLRAGVE
jgi:hypothetical protein